MPLVPLRTLLDHAADHGYGLPAFNVNNMEQVLAVTDAAAEVDAPVILQASRGARAYAGDAMLMAMVRAAVEAHPNLPMCLHQDHGNSVETCDSAIGAGFTSVMMDGSLEEDGKTPASYEYNVDVTAKVVELAHAAGASVEGELGCLGSLETGTGEQEDGHGAVGELSHDQLVTDPDEAVDFVTRTGVDALAVAVGTSHGAYKFTREPDGEILAISTIKAINKRLPNLHMVMHGASSVPQDLQDRFRATGGDMPATWGVPVSEIQQAIQYGVRKINIDTDCRIAMAAAVRGVLQNDPSQFDPRKFLAPARGAMQEVCRQRFEQFGAAGKVQALSI